MRFLQDARWLDMALKGVTLLVVVAIGYLAFTIVSVRSQESRTAPASIAIQNLVAAIAENPDEAALRITLAEAYAANGQFREAIEQFNVALELDENNSAALTGLGLVAMFQGEWVVAEGYWRTIIDTIGGGQFSSLDQRLGIAYHQLGLTLIEQKRYEEAAQYLHEALRVNRAASDTHYALSVAYREVGSEMNQRTYLENTLMFDPSMPEANYDYGLLLLADGDLAGAAEHFRTSADRAPASRREPQDELDKLGPYDDRIAEARRLTETDPAAALVEARIARALQPTELDTAKLVAELYEVVGETQSAMEAWQDVLDIEPGDAEAKAAVDRLRQ